MPTNTSRSFRLRVSRRACDAFGAVDYTLTDTLTEQDGGLLVVAVAVGRCEGERVDHRSEKFWPGVTLEAAVAYRLRNGYVEIT